ERTAEARALGTADVVQIVDGYITGFQKAVDEGKVRFDSPADLDRLVRLKELMLGNADSRQELQGGLTLDAIQQRHQRLRTQMEAMTPELSGTVTEMAGEDADGGSVH
ncbi:MAG: AT hook motif domain protein, partial [Deltaproteobacteria bacterium]|nr:AT hook motif domain protein [Deltaproteobacteria bacterium]